MLAEQPVVVGRHLVEARPRRDSFQARESGNAVRQDRLKSGETVRVGTEVLSLRLLRLRLRDDDRVALGASPVDARRIDDDRELEGPGARQRGANELLTNR